MTQQQTTTSAEQPSSVTSPTTQQQPIFERVARAILEATGVPKLVAATEDDLGYTVYTKERG
jgi:hypothetical protein